MRAIVAWPKRKDSAKLIEIDPPKPAVNELLLKIEQLGIDGTDKEINEGLYGEAPDGSDYLILGHEALARIETKGSEVSELAPGQLVVPTVRRPGNCPNCRGGESDMCLDGRYKEHGIRQLHGFASNYAVTDADFVVPIPPELEDVAVLLEPLSVAEKALFQIKKIQERLIWSPKSTLVLGAGTLGLLVSILFRMKGFDVTTVARRPSDSPKARILSSVGSKYINSSENSLDSFDENYDIIVEATGNANVAMQSSGLLNTNGVLCLLGVYRNQVVSEDAGNLFRNFVLGNKLVFGSVNANKKYFELGLSDMAEIKMRFPGVLQRLITSRLSPEEYLKVFHPDSEEIKSVIQFN
jgi:threonine dehydrogenase-like Zn-dependent dehydrogenase